MTLTMLPGERCKMVVERLETTGSYRRRHSRAGAPEAVSPRAKA